MTDFTLPIRDDLVGVQSYGAPQLDVAAPMNAGIMLPGRTMSHQEPTPA